MNTLPKSERVSGKAAVSALMSKGRWGFARGLKYCYLANEDEEDSPVANRVMVSVPKRLFKRAVRRNLLKRRLREAFRLLIPRLDDHTSYVVVARAAAAKADYRTLADSLQGLLARQGKLH